MEWCFKAHKIQSDKASIRCEKTYTKAEVRRNHCPQVKSEALILSIKVAKKRTDKIRERDIMILPTKCSGI